MKPEIRIESVEIVAKAWGTLKKTVFDYQRRDGSWDRQVRETYDHGHGAAIVPYDPDRGTVLLVRQFRFPAYAVGHEEALIEACAGLLDADAPEIAIRREAEEELGYRLRDVHFLYAPFMTPGSVTERLWCFAAHYSAEDKVSDGGGHPEEGEDIEVLEMTLDDALAAIKDGIILDAKTIILLQQLRLSLL